jgi:hypothetical protein
MKSLNHEQLEMVSGAGAAYSVVRQPDHIPPSQQSQQQQDANKQGKWAWPF